MSLKSPANPNNTKRGNAASEELQKSLLEYKRPELANAKHSELNRNVRQTTPSGAQTNLMANTPT